MYLCSHVHGCTCRHPETTTHDGVSKTTNSTDLPFLFESKSLCFSPLPMPGPLVSKTLGFYCLCLLSLDMTMGTTHIIHGIIFLHFCYCSCFVDYGNFCITHHLTRPYLFFLKKKKVIHFLLRFLS